MHRTVKEWLRRQAVRLCHGLLRVGSTPYQLGSGPALVIAPHQDDETLACGGIISRMREEGIDVQVVFITDGSASHPNHPRLNPSAIAELRHKEAMKALRCLHVESTAIHFLNQPDGHLPRLDNAERESVIGSLAGLIRAISPQEIFLPCHPDGSSEHDTVFGFVTEAVAQTGLQLELWQYPVWSWWNPTLLLRRWLATDDCRRLPLEDHTRAKLAAIQCYQSQIAPLPPGSTPALPPSLVDIFRADAEYFFLHGKRNPPR